MSFAIVLEGMTLITYMVILSGGKQKRESGWKILSGMHFLVAALQLAGMAIIVSDTIHRRKACIGLGSKLLTPMTRRTSTRMTTASSQDGNSTYHGFCAP